MKSSLCSEKKEGLKEVIKQVIISDHWQSNFKLGFLGNGAGNGDKGLIISCPFPAGDDVV